MMMAPIGHVPVLLGPILEAVAPVRGVWLDGTLGAGGYAQKRTDNHGRETEERQKYKDDYMKDIKK